MTPFSGGSRNSSWQAVAAVAVALVLGLGVGALLEHKRALDDSNTPAPRVTTTTKPKTSVWFGTKTGSACPKVRQWYGAAANAYIALVSSTDWTKTREALQLPVGAAEQSYNALLPLANSAGKKELAFLLTTLGKSKDLIKKSTSAAAVFDKPVSSRQRSAIQVMVKTAQTCTEK